MVTGGGWVGPHTGGLRSLWGSPSWFSPEGWRPFPPPHPASARLGLSEAQDGPGCPPSVAGGFHPSPKTLPTPLGSAWAR